MAEDFAQIVVWAMPAFDPRRGEAWPCLRHLLYAWNEPCKWHGKDVRPSDSAPRAVPDALPVPVAEELLMPSPNVPKAPKWTAADAPKSKSEKIRSEKGRSEKGRSEKGRPFPPLSTSLEVFLDGGSDERFRDLIYKVLSTSALMLRSRDRFATVMGVSGPQYSMMVAIGEAGSATVGQIAEKLRVSSPFVTAEVGKLVRKGALSRELNQNDRRSSLLTLTKKGKDMIVSVGPLRQMTNDIIFGSLTKEQALAIHAIMDKLVVDSERALHAANSPVLGRNKSR